MKQFLFTALLLLQSVGGYSQHQATIGNKSAPVDHDADAAVSSQTTPRFAGGKDAIDEFINENLKYPEVAREARVQGKVIVRFMVDVDGKVKYATVPWQLGISDECDKEAVRVVLSMPNWEPGKVDGKPVQLWETIPVMFVLNEDGD